MSRLTISAFCFLLSALAKVAELADALDLGSSGPKPCGFESRLSHQQIQSRKQKAESRNEADDWSRGAAFLLSAF
jgi:hypothetical protein